MRHRFIWMGTALLAVTLSLGLGRSEQTPPTAELVLRGGAIYTMDATRRWADAVAIAGGKIVYVGTDRDVENWIGASTQVVDLEGKMVLPGFHDAHVHPVSGGIELAQCNLNELTSREDVYRAISEYAQSHAERDWIVGGGWSLPLFPNANPRKEDLDRLVPDRPVYLSAADGHSAWVNSRALQIAGIDANTADPPPDGRIERDAATGEPTGTLRESAMDLVARHRPQLTEQERVEGLRRGLEMANGFGITSFVEASAGEEELSAYAALARAGELSARVVASLYVDPLRGEEQVPALVARRDRFRMGRLRPTAVKLFADGVLEAHTAAVLEPYLGIESRGTLNFSPPLMERLVTRLDQEGFQIHIHAIGDRGIRTSLDALEAARKANGPRDARAHIAHIELFDPGDIPRFRRLNVIANFQPLWAYADTYITELTEPFLDAARSRWLYPIETLLRSGAVVVGGSDWSVSSMNPLDAIQVALTRRALDRSEGESWIPEERADLPSMLAAYTINGAYLMRQEDVTGSLEGGKSADVIVLDRNLFEIEPYEIHQARVLWTLLEGNEVFRDQSFIVRKAAILGASHR